MELIIIRLVQAQTPRIPKLAPRGTPYKVGQRRYRWGRTKPPKYCEMAKKVFARFAGEGLGYSLEKHAHVPYPRAKTGQASLLRALQATHSTLTHSSLTRWKQPWPRGTGGRIPLCSWPDVLRAADSCYIVGLEKNLIKWSGGVNSYYRKTRKRPSGKKGVGWK